MSELIAADVREALLRMAGGDWCDLIARRAVSDGEILACLHGMAWQVARERAAMAAEARAEGDR